MHIYHKKSYTYKVLSKRLCALSDSDPSMFLEMLNKKIFWSEWVIDHTHFVWGRQGSNRGPLRLRQFLTVLPAKTVKKVAEWSEAQLRMELSWL